MIKTPLRDIAISTLKKALGEVKVKKGEKVDVLFIPYGPSKVVHISVECRHCQQRTSVVVKRTTVARGRGSGTEVVARRRPKFAY